MAQNVHAAGFPLTVWNRRPERCGPLADAGATVAETPARAAANADVVLYCLAHDDAVDAVVFGADGVLAGISGGAVAVDLSTVHPDTSRRQATAYARQEVRFLDAPVFGSRSEAQAGTLWLVVGGPEDGLDRARPVLDAIGRQIHHMGTAPGSGAAMKLCGNLLVASMFEALAESLMLGTSAGLDAAAMLEVLDAVDFRSPLFKGVGTAMRERRFDDPSFALRWMLKDAALIERFAADQGVPAPGIGAARSMLQSAVDDGHGHQDAAALIRALESRAGRRLNDGRTDGRAGGRAD
jgi:3-hydroxyisobutyrate dehydrogenase-like beta-hydroxyacid dehydrogenase